MKMPPPWRPDDRYASEVLFDVISSRSALSGAGNDGQMFAHLQSIIHTDIGRKEFGRGMTASWRRIVDEPYAFPPEFWQLFLRSSLTALGGKCRPVGVRMTWRKLIAAGSMRQWRSRLEEVNREVRQFEVAVPGGVDPVSLRATVERYTRPASGSFSQTAPTPSTPLEGQRCLQTWPIACQRSRRYWPSATARDPLTCFCG